MWADYDHLLLQAGNAQLSDTARRYACFMSYSSCASQYAYFLFAFFLAMGLEFQIRSWKPDSAQEQAFLAFFLAVAAFSLLHLVKMCLQCWAGDPLDHYVFEASQQMTNPEQVSTSSSVHLARVAEPINHPVFQQLVVPLATVNTQSPVSPWSFAQYQARLQHQGKIAQSASHEAAISPEVLKFNPTMKDWMKNS